jgi:hypothetical protein
VNTRTSLSLTGAPRHPALRSFTMNSTTRLMLAAALFTLAQGAFAHDPAEHAREAAEAKKGANCAAMKNMDMSKADPNDVVMKAMMAKCAKQAEGHDEHAGHDHAHGDTAAPAAAKPKAQPDTHEGH